MESNSAKKSDTESRAEAAVDEILKQLFVADVTTAAEFHSLCRRRVRTPEAELMAALLENGIADYRRFVFARDKKRACAFSEAESWILRDDSDWVFSFDNCCAVLAIDAGYLRKGLLAWRRAQGATGNLSPRPCGKNILRQAA